MSGTISGCPAFNNDKEKMIGKCEKQHNLYNVFAHFINFPFPTAQSNEAAGEHGSGRSEIIAGCLFNVTKASNKQQIHISPLYFSLLHTLKTKESCEMAERRSKKINGVKALDNQ